MSWGTWGWTRLDPSEGERRWERLNAKLAALAQWTADATRAARGVGALALNDPRPSVAGRAVWRVANTAPTTVTAFREGAAGQTVALWCDDAVTTLAHSATLALAGGVNYTTAPGRVLLFVTLDGATWREVQR